ncbi:MAG TPA: site-2 protease family protein [Chloroflexota bacterium]
MGGTLTIVRLFGIRFAVNVSWLFVFALVTYSLGGVLFPELYPWWPAWLSWTVGATTSLLFFLCVLLHELAHSLVALRHGIPVRSITLFLFGGVAQLGREAPTPRAEFLVAAAGPAMSFVLTALFGVLLLLEGLVPHPVRALATWLAGINFSLAAFNLLPGFPLDGGRLLRAVVWRFSGDYLWASRLASAMGQFAAFGLIAAGLLGGLPGWGGDALSGLWFAMVGLFLYSAAVDGYRMARLHADLQDRTVRDFMIATVAALASDLTVEATRAYGTLWNTRVPAAVLHDGRLVGLVGAEQLRSVPWDQEGQTSLASIMVPVSETACVSPDTPVLLALERFGEAGLGVLPVVENGEVVGMLTLDTVLRQLRSRPHGPAGASPR